MELVIVESPSKCKTIQTLLGPNFKCSATCGHIVELRGLESLGAPTFEPAYSTIPRQKTRLAAMRRMAKQAVAVWLATDADREGEAIAFHVSLLLGIDPSKKNRIRFSEITQGALRHAMRNPDSIDMSLVGAQMSRQAVDMMVGFRLSPYLWDLAPKLSCGRCQTPALRMIAEAALETAPTETKVIGHGIFTACRLRFAMDNPPKFFRDAKALLAARHDHRIVIGVETAFSESPPKPFDTVLLQQASYNALGIPPAETMSLAQSLYEAGRITYMRTDSTGYSVDFSTKAAWFITQEFGKQFVLTSPPVSTGAHEAIRVTDLEDTPAGSSKIDKLYRLIWNNSLQSLMSEHQGTARLDKVVGTAGLSYSRNAKLTTFSGWREAAGGTHTGEDFAYLERLSRDDDVGCSRICIEETCMVPHRQYTEAGLIARLRRAGIGRPSTFASIVAKLIERKYVEFGVMDSSSVELRKVERVGGEVFESTSSKSLSQSGKLLRITGLGRIALERLMSLNLPIFDYGYTAELELELDMVARGCKDRVEVCRNLSKTLDSYTLVNAPPKTTAAQPRVARRSSGRSKSKGRSNV